MGKNTNGKLDYTKNTIRTDENILWDKFSQLMTRKNKKGINIYGFVNFKDRVAEQHLKDRQVVRGYGWINLRENNRRLDDTGRPIVDLNLYIDRELRGFLQKYSFEKDEPHWEQQRQPQQPQQQRQYVEENDYVEILPDDLPF